MVRASTVRSVMATGLVALCSLACNELEETITAPRLQASVNLPQAARSARRFKELSVDSLWLMIAAGDSSAIVGVKPPGASRGVIKGRVGADRNLLNRAERDLERLGVSIAARSATIPAMRVRIDGGVSQLGRLLAQPWLDYVEPAVIRGSITPQIGCENPAYDGTQHMTWGDVTDMVPYTYNSMDISDAWALSSGDGVTIGLTDTGIFSSNSQLTTNMTAGYSSIRTYEYLHTSNYGSAYISDSDCSHGTRRAGSIAAPRDGVGPIGVAWGADFVSVRHNDDVATFDTWYAVQAIDMAAARSNIVVMAWGAPDWWYNSIEDAITYWHYNWDRLFIGAAGTYAGWEPYEFRNNTFFPAEVEEVVAVTAVDYPSGNLSSNAAHGPGVDIAAFSGQVSTGKGSDLTTLMGSSNASGVTAGVAAMIWSRYPWMTRDQVRHRLYLTARGNPFQTEPLRVGDTGYGTVNAYRALGGFWHMSLDGPTCVDGRQGMVTLTAIARGDGPFTYTWSNGSNESSINIEGPPRGESAYYYVYVYDALQGRTLGAELNIVALAVDDPRRSCDEG